MIILMGQEIFARELNYFSEKTICGEFRKDCIGFEHKTDASAFHILVYSIFIFSCLEIIESNKKETQNFLSEYPLFMMIVQLEFY